MPLSKALERVQDRREKWVIVRQHQGLQLLYYAFPTYLVIGLLGNEHGMDDVDIGTALHLENMVPTDTLDSDFVAGDQKTRFAVLLDDAHILGIYESRGDPPPVPPPPPPEAALTDFLAPPARLINRARTATRSATPPNASPAPIKFQAFPTLNAKDVVEPGEMFDLVIGLSLTPEPGTLGTSVSAQLPPSTAAFDLDVHLLAEGFASPAGWFFRMRVESNAPEKEKLTIQLIAPRDEVTRLTMLEAHFSIGGVPCGLGFKKIAVQRSANGASASISGRAWHATTPTCAIVIDPEDLPPDLWITISKPDGNEANGRYYWSFMSPHAIALPPEPIAIDLGDDARTFAGKIIQLVTRAEGTPLIDQALNALGRQIRDQAPANFEDVLQAVYAVVHPSGRVPTILLHSAEPYVPWELTLLADPPDATLPPFLGAQFAIGRWILGARAVRVPPAREVVVRNMAVVIGDYRSSLNLRPLAKAQAEGEELERRWGALRLSATVDQMNLLLEAKLERAGAVVGGAQAIHFACHGEIDPRNPEAATIYLDDDWPLDASLFLDAPLGRKDEPFLFLNACQVGQAGELLGDYAGFAGSCLRNNFRGFVAPLWSVSDDIAHAIALEFYDRAFSKDPAPVAEILRSVRCRYPATDKVPPSTWLAYVFYGNPNFVLRRA